LTINGSQGYFVSMPSRRRKDGTFQDLAHPVNNDLRKVIEDTVLDAFESELDKLGLLPPETNSPIEALVEEEIRA
jgi:DNA-binding cell septation regulator SpoVG